MKRSLKTTKAKPRLAISTFLFLFMFLVVGLRAFQLQILQGKKLKRLGEKQHHKEWIVLPKRGAILDRAGEPLALSVEARSVYARPQRIKEPDNIARPLARILNLNSMKLQRKLKAEKPFVWIKRQITPKQAEKISALNLAGIGMSLEPKRYYPQGHLGGQVIGFAGRDSQGLEGVELRFDRYIRGETGSSVTERDALGRRVLVQGVENLQIPPGADIRLTLDTSIQHLAEKQLKAAVAKFRAKSGLVVVVEPFTGEVLALANYPFFNPNNFTRYSARRWRNRTVADSFEPGSTFKAILAAAALQEGVVGKNDLFFCEFGRYPYGGRIVHDSHKYGWLPFYKILQYSSNIGATKVAAKLKKERYFRYIKKFGFGQATQIDLPGESAGMLRSPDKWSAIDLATHAFGQGISATPIQLAMAYGVIANGGFLMRPFVVREVVSPEGKVLRKTQPYVVRRVISEKTAHTLTSILKGVVRHGGTGLMAGVEGFEVAGKTGTAQKPDLVHGGYSKKKRVASFIGFVPADDPRLVLLVLVDEPQLSVYGGAVAAPAFRNIARGALRHLRVVPDRPESLPLLTAQKGSLVGVKFKNANESPEHKITRREVPNFVGLSLREALEKARTLDVNVKMLGDGYVIRQSPPPGAAWEKNETLTLKLQG
ncbi:MAG: penicillin-binding protein [Candidatus Binatia bacterium]